MPGKRILVINGHPDGRPERLAAGLADAYRTGAIEGGHEVRGVTIGLLDFPLIQTAEEFIGGAPPPAIAAAQDDIRWAQHIVIIHPLWLGGAPAQLKGFLEQVFRYDFALPAQAKGWPKGLLAGRSARLIVTMGMPAVAYRMMFGAAGVRAIEGGVLRLAGFSPVRRSLIGGVGEGRASAKPGWPAMAQRLGREAA